jgi:hypothetical protein
VKTLDPTEEKPVTLAMTGGALLLALVFYPTTIAPIGTFSNGGHLGLGSLVLASGLSWSAFILNRRFFWWRILFQIPVTILVTYMAIHDACNQYVSAKLLRFLNLL